MSRPPFTLLPPTTEPLPGDAGGGGERILLYSHDSYGLGHLRRSMTLATRLAQDLPGSAVLIASGSPCATHFPPPPGVDVVKLPCVGKDEDGRYVPRTLGGALDGVLALRGALLGSLVEAWKPDVLVVDHQVLGLRGELRAALDLARDRGVATVLGLRDVLDEPEAVAREWGSAEVRAALESGYDRLCVYGSASVFDPRVEYRLPDAIAGRMELLGYVVRPAPVRSLAPLPADRRQVLVTMGGGQDGADRIEAYLQCLQLGAADWESIIVLGPLLDPARARRIKRRARHLAGVTIHSFHADLPGLLSDADAVVAMCGYNTTAEILQSGVPAVLLPRTFPRREQLLRAQRLAALGLAQCLPLPEPRALRAAVEAALRQGSVTCAPPPLDGARRLAGVAAELLHRPARTRLSLP